MEGRMIERMEKCKGVKNKEQDGYKFLGLLLTTFSITGSMYGKIVNVPIASFQV
jgi:hypothetical protein